jgi:hypothetical protein
MTDMTHILKEGGPYASTILNAADYLNAEVKVFTDRHGKTYPIFKLPCGMCQVYTDAEVQDMALKQSMFEAIYPKG